MSAIGEGIMVAAICIALAWSCTNSENNDHDLAMAKLRCQPAAQQGQAR